MTAWKLVLAGVAVLLGVGLALHGEPGPVELAAMKKAELDARLEAREVHLDPAEVLRLLHDRRIPIDLVDLRDEVDFNLVHLVDARRATLDDLADPSRWPPFRPLALKILISNDEGRAEAAWRLLAAAGVRGVYILAGGMNLWVRVFRDGETNAQPQPGEGRLRPTFDAARGASWAFARPDPDAAEGRSFAEKAKPLTTVVELAGGCGG